MPKTVETVEKRKPRGVRPHPTKLRIIRKHLSEIQKGATRLFTLFTDDFLSPFQGLKCLLVSLPRALPWASLFCPFRANKEKNPPISHRGLKPLLNSRG